MVSVAVPAAVPVIETGVVEPKENVGRSCAPLGLAVKDAVNATLPVKPPLGVTVIVEVFPVTEPGTTLTAVPFIVKPGPAVTVTIRVVVALNNPEVPVTVTITGPPNEAVPLAVSVIS
jgi:hypothetical protein